jgi:hypothetical protein
MPFSSAYFLAKWSAQRQDDARPLAQRRQAQVHDVQPVEQVLAEGAFAHGIAEIAGWRSRSP